MYPSIISLASIRLFAVYLAQWVYQDSNLKPFGYEPSALTIAPQTLNDIMLPNHTPPLQDVIGSVKPLRQFPFIYCFSSATLFTLYHIHFAYVNIFSKKSLIYKVDQLRDVAPHLLSGIICYHQTMFQSNNHVVSRLSFQMLSTSIEPKFTPSAPRIIYFTISNFESQQYFLQVCNLGRGGAVSFLSFHLGLYLLSTSHFSNYAYLPYHTIYCAGKDSNLT